MRIGVIGAGHVGTILSRQFALIGHEVSLGGLLVARNVRGVAAFADVAVLAVPFGRHRELPVAELAGKPVIDTTNYEPDLHGRVRALDNDLLTSSELVQRHLRGAHVVKTLNAIGWEHLRDHAYRDRLVGRRAVPVSGDDLKAKKTAMALVEELGFDPVDVGGLRDGGRKHQPGTDVFAADLTADSLRARLHLTT
jgi:predicted dinucleotide-binding enzyme